ncbi:hypothetical protein K458DRAFT_390862 [Lentithecium fluviatile CBS 122367]|uniref:Uncharacterized protein n=1 Tax=Lentithecium fluviatile CBS 122367 TaxID=1168545 RepID=A0A6G1IW89_9PLEO|nr:hypothetical protein K458DRAFT_390862 [Lentithecium fluviatile CBS 122367]
MSPDLKYPIVRVYENVDCRTHALSRNDAPPDHSRSIIAITGLDGHAYGSWRGKGNLGRMRLRDFLSKDLPCCRTMIYGYNSKLSTYGIETIMDDGRGLIEELKKIRDTAELRKRPLFFVAHSFGGIILAHCLMKAVQTNEDDHPTIASLHKATYGMLLFGIPHKGLVVDDIEKMLAGQNKHPRGALLEQIRSKSDLLAFQLADFKNLMRDRKVDSESKRWKRTGEFVTAVNTDSALLQLPDSIEDEVPVDADHSMMVKFDSTSRQGYSSARAKLQQFEQDAPGVVAGRFRVLENEKRGNVHWMVPRAVNSLFIGRAELIDRIQQAFDVGKRSDTRAQQRFVITGWGRANNPTTAKNDFVAIAKALGLSVESIDEARQALASTKRRWLLVLDDADDPRSNYTAYIPSGAEGAIIMTSRIPDCRRYSTAGHEMLEGLGLEDSTELLLRAAAIDATLRPCHQKQAQDIVELVCSHTLALIQAGAYIAEGHCRLDQYPEKYERQRKRLLEHHPEQEQSRYRHVYANLEASIEVLSRSDTVDQDALDLLGVLAMVHSTVLPLQVFEDAWSGSRQVLERKRASNTGTDEVDATTPWHVPQLPELVGARGDGWDDYRLVRASGRLVSLSLVTRHGQGSLDGLSMHPLAHAWAKDRLEKAWQRQSWTSTGCLIALSRGQSNLWQVRQKELRPHMQSFLSAEIDVVLSYGTHEAMLPILLACGWIFNTMREDGRLARLLDSIYTEYRIRPSQPAEEYLPVWDLAASNMHYMGKVKQAVALLEHVVKVRETTVAEKHLDRLASQHELASAYQDNGQVKEAVALLEHVVKVEETTLSENHPDQLASQHTLARAYQDDGQAKEAVALLEHVVKVSETTLAENHPSRLASQHELAIAYRANGQVKEAVELLEHVVQVKQEVYNPDHPSRLVSESVLQSWYAAG